jgi:hypothetical protein
VAYAVPRRLGREFGSGGPVDFRIRGPSLQVSVAGARSGDIPKAGRDHEHTRPFFQSPKIPLHSPDMPPGSVSAGLSITHLVFASLLHRTPVFVGTGGVWCVEGDQISFLGQQPPA